MGRYEKMKQAVEAQGGVHVVTLGDLRSAIGVARLGPYVLEDIANQLRQEGLEYFPRLTLDDNPAPRQWHPVRLILANPASPIYKAMKAIEDPTEDGDAFLADLGTSAPVATAARAEQKLQRVRGALQDALAVLDEPDDAETA